MKFYLYEIGVPRTVYVSVVSLFCTVLQMCGVDGDTSVSLLGRVVDRGVILEIKIQ